MSTQDVGSFVEPSSPAGPLGAANAFPLAADDGALPRSTGRRAGGATAELDRRWVPAETAEAGLVLGPWGPRPFSAPVGDYREGPFTSMLRSVDRLALSLVYVAVLGGLPLVAVTFLTNGA